MTEQSFDKLRTRQIREEITRLEDGYDREAATGVKLVALAAAKALRWALGDGDTAPSEIVGK